MPEFILFFDTKRIDGSTALHLSANDRSHPLYEQFQAAFQIMSDNPSDNFIGPHQCTPGRPGAGYHANSVVLTTPFRGNAENLLGFLKQRITGLVRVQPA